MPIQQKKNNIFCPLQFNLQAVEKFKNGSRIWDILGPGGFR